MYSYFVGFNFALEDYKMDKTNAQEFRANLKEWLDQAEQEPIKVTRKSGESLVIVNSEDFEKMQTELAHLKGLAKGLSDSLAGRTVEFSSALLKSTIKKSKTKTSKKAV